MGTLKVPCATGRYPSSSGRLSASHPSSLSTAFRLRLRFRGSSPALLSVMHHPRSPGSPEGATTYQPRLQAGACNGQRFLTSPERAGYDLQAQWFSIMVNWWECAAPSGLNGHSLYHRPGASPRAGMCRPFRADLCQTVGPLFKYSAKLTLPLRPSSNRIQYV
jgi:hypothetical protein